MRRGELTRARREDLDRLADWLGLRHEPSWSKRHLASLIWWRLSRAEKRRRGRTQF